MSNHLAIATVTAALGSIVHDAAKSAVPGAGLQFGRPPQPAADLRLVNIYLYQAVPYGGLRNEDLPQRNAAGRLVQRPRAAIALHYLVTFYGDDAQFEPERMLGAAIRELHASPQLTAGDIADAIAGSAALTNSDLADGPERVKFSPLALTLDEMSRLWSVMIQTPHSLSMAWQGAVVLIDALGDVQASPPVLRRGPEDRGPETSAALPPSINQLWLGMTGTQDRTPLPPSMTAATLGGVIRIAGERLGGIDTVTVEIVSTSRTDQSIAATRTPDGSLIAIIPNDAAAATAYAAGPIALRVALTQDSATQRSAIAPLLLAPSITGLSPDPLAAGGMQQLDVACAPQVLPAQRVTLRLGSLEIAADAHAAPTANLSFHVDTGQVANGALAYLTVDGVTSQPVTFDAALGVFAFDDAQRVHVA